MATQDTPAQLTPEQQKILGRIERRMAVLGRRNRRLVAKIHKHTGNRYVPKRRYV